jgi:hypothetical protein
VLEVKREHRMAIGNPRWGIALAGAFLAAAVGPAWAQSGAAAAQFLVVVGDVRILGRDGSQRVAARAGELREGETIVTGPNGLAQLRLADGGSLMIRADTEMKLDRFAFAGKDDRSASMLVSLLKGGFRSITGLIGQLNRDGYRITTPSATIGIRGTDHEPFVQIEPPPGVRVLVEPGTYDFVRQGQTFMQNRQGATQIVNANQVGFVPFASGAAPRVLTTIPPIYLPERLRPQPPVPGAPSTTSPTAPDAAAPRPLQVPPSTAPKAPIQPPLPARDPPGKGPMGNPPTGPAKSP